MLECRRHRVQVDDDEKEKITPNATSKRVMQDLAKVRACARMHPSTHSALNALPAQVEAGTFDGKRLPKGLLADAREAKKQRVAKLEVQRCAYAHADD